jgi:hypothetical protein
MADQDKTSVRQRPRLRLLGWLALASILALAILGPSAAGVSASTQLHQATPISSSNINFQGSDEDCAGANLAPGEVLWHFVLVQTAAPVAGSTLTATFQTVVIGPQQVSLTVQKAGTGGGTVTSGDGQINCGAGCAAGGTGAAGLRFPRQAWCRREETSGTRRRSLPGTCGKSRCRDANRLPERPRSWWRRHGRPTRGAAQVALAIDQKFANSPYETKTDTERAFQSSFVSMFGNLNLLLGSIALAVVITTLFVAGNTMAMSVRERTTEIAVMRTLGFPSATIFLLVAGEGLLMSIVGGVIGILAAKAIVNPDLLQAGAFIPVFGVNTTNLLTGLGLSALIGVLAGLIPATMASRLGIVDALRRVA